MLSDPAIASLLDDLDEFVADLLDSFDLPGLGIAVGTSQTELLARGFGVRSLASRAPFTAATRVPVASISKLYCASAALRLAEHGQLDLDEPVRERLPDLPLVNPAGGPPITARHLLSFRSGLHSDHVDLAGRRGSLTEHVHARLDRGRPVAYAGQDVHGRALPMWARATGSGYEYSNLGIDVVGALIERTCGPTTSYADLLQSAILQPLGIADAFRWTDLADGHAQCGRYTTRVPMLPTAGAASAGLALSARQQLAWLQMMLADGEYAGRQVLQPSSVVEMIRPVTFGAGPGEPDTGLVVESRGTGRDRWFGELGAYPWGWVTEARAYPELDLAVVVCTNRWNLGAGYPGRDSSPHGLLTDFVRDHWLEGSDAGGEAHTGWRHGYVCGLLLADRLHGVLGVEEASAGSELERCAAGYVHGEVAGMAQFDPEGFRAGFRDRQAMGSGPVNILEMVESLPVTRQELRLFFAAAGRPGGRVPIPSTAYVPPEVADACGGI